LEEEKTVRKKKIMNPSFSLRSCFVDGARCVEEKQRHIKFGEEKVVVGRVDGEIIDDVRDDSEANAAGMAWWNSAPLPAKKGHKTIATIQQQRKKSPSPNKYSQPLRNDGEKEKEEEEETEVKKTPPLASKKNRHHNQDSKVTPLCVVNVIVNGALLCVSSGGGVRIAPPSTTTTAAAAVTGTEATQKQQLHVVCLSESGCIVHVGGVGVCALGFGEAVSFTSPSFSGCGGGGLWVAFCANSASKTRVPPPDEGRSSSGEKNEEISSSNNIIIYSEEEEEENTLEEKSEKDNIITPKGCTNDPLFFGAIQQVWLGDIGRAAAQGGGRWRSFATSFSTMVRFLQRYTTELRWQRPADGEPTIVEWGAEEEEEEEDEMQEEVEEEEEPPRGGW
jgi:hypothetical protein